MRTVETNAPVVQQIFRQHLRELSFSNAFQRSQARRYDNVVSGTK